jgi:hypothetical protein
LRLGVVVAIVSVGVVAGTVVVCVGVVAGVVAGVVVVVVSVGVVAVVVGVVVVSVGVVTGGSEAHAVEASDAIASSAATTACLARRRLIIGLRPPFQPRHRTDGCDHISVHRVNHLFTFGPLTHVN